jgi:outer membrane protein assembly factor BamA
MVNVRTRLTSANNPKDRRGYKRPGPDFRRWLAVGVIGGVIILNCLVNAAELAPAGVSGERPHGTTLFDGTIIDSIILEPRNIYNTREPRYDRWLFRFANALHYVTRQKIIRRELLFQVGDSFSTDLAEELARNLRTKYALNDAWVAPEILPNGHLVLRVVTVDKWSLVGGVRLHREGNQTNYQFGFEERNLLGYHQFLSFDYVVQEKENNYVVAKFADRRLWGFPLTLNLEYSDNPLNIVTSSELSHPYFNLSQRWSYFIGHARTGGRGDFYHDTVSVASAQRSGDLVTFGAAYRWGPYRTKFGLGAEYRYMYTNTYNRRIFSPLDSAKVVFPEDSIYHRVSMVAQYSNYDFAKVYRLTGMKYTEDLTLGFSARMNFARAYAPHFHDFIFDEIGLELAYSYHWGGSIFFADYGRSISLRENSVLRRGNRVGLRYYNTTLPFMTVAVRSLYQSETRADGGNTLILGGLNGIRGYDTYFRTGDRLQVVNMELRFFPKIEILSVILGGAVFADLGRTWKQGEALAFKNYHRSIGAGLRVSLEKLSKGELVRVDLAYGQNNVWQLSIGSRQYF